MGGGYGARIQSPSARVDGTKGRSVIGAPHCTSVVRVFGFLCCVGKAD
jgi:hypothetical protein